MRESARRRIIGGLGVACLLAGMLAATCLPTASAAASGVASKSKHCVPRPGAYLVRCNFTNADLANVDLSFARLGYANLTGANLTGANLSYAYLNRSNLTGASISGANFKSTRQMRQAKLTGIIEGASTLR